MIAVRPLSVRERRDGKPTLPKRLMGSLLRGRSGRAPWSAALAAGTLDGDEAASSVAQGANAAAPRPIPTKPLAREAFSLQESNRAPMQRNEIPAYDPRAVEQKWQRIWADTRAWETSNPVDAARADKPKSYVV